MKIKFIAAAALALCSSASFAAVKVICDTTTPLKMANTCVPETVLYVAGSSALGAAITGVIPTLFKDGAYTTISDTSATFNSSNTTAYYGISTTTNKRLYVVYNKNNGSAAGVNQVMVKIGKTAADSLPEATVVKVGPTVAGANTCVELGTSTTAAPKVSCATVAPTQADLAITDVAPRELYKLDPKAAKTKFSALTNKALGLQGFGVAVNWNFYQALQTQNVADKLIPSTCVAGDITAACQPTIRALDYATLVTKNPPVVKGASIFIPNDNTALVLARRDDLSGTQATSNIFFGNGACGVIPLKSTNLGGAMEFISSADFPEAGPNAAKLISKDLAVSGDVTTALGASTGYSIGVVGLSSSKNIAASTWNFVKIDGQSPNYLPDGTAAYKGRTAFANGHFPIAVTSYATFHTANLTKVADKLALVDIVIKGMADSSKSDLAGVAYLDGKEETDLTKPKQSKVQRGLDGNNCSPMVRK